MIKYGSGGNKARINPLQSANLSNVWEHSKGKGANSSLKWEFIFKVSEISWLCRMKQDHRDHLSFTLIINQHFLAALQPAVWGLNSELKAKCLSLSSMHLFHCDLDTSRMEATFPRSKWKTKTKPNKGGTGSPSLMACQFNSGSTLKS